MKIAEVVAVFPPYPGGTGYVCYHNARELAKRGHDVTVFTLDFGQLRHADNHSEFTVVRLKTPFMFGGAGIVPQLYSKLRAFDVIHLHYPFFGGAEYIYLASLLQGKRYFLMYHQDVRGDSFPKKLFLGLYERLFLKRIIRGATKLGMLSVEHLKSSKAAAFLDWGKVVEMPNGVDTDIFSPREKDPALVQRFGLKDKTIILFVGHLLPFKGLPILINALAMIKNPNIILMVVGTGPLEQEYRKLVAKNGLGERVFFAGYQSQQEDLPRFYNTCDFFVLPSVGAPESFGMVVVEAMASGKPAIVSSLPGPMQLIEHGKDGFVAPVGDPLALMEKIVFLSEEKEICLTMGLAARQKVLRLYSWDRAGDLLESVLKEIAGS
jgi:glycosyltransferase involved in cell wall biosynthesis